MARTDSPQGAARWWRRIVWALALTAARLAAAQSEPGRIYLSPEGDDARTGATAGAAVRTLGRAEQILREEVAQRPREMEVRIGSGIYAGEEVKWRFSMPTYRINFQPAEEGQAAPIFEGGGKANWFLFRGPVHGEATNLVFKNLTVRHYGTAISFSGDRMAAASSSRGNVIEGCDFLEVGENSTAAVRLVNSAGNWILHCRFASIVRQTDGGLLHAIYAAHHSSENYMAGNLFEQCCGDPIRFRDDSSRNTVTGNRFIHAGVEAAVSDWFCDHEMESDCTKPAPECGSWDNTVKGNVLVSSFSGRPLPATYVYSSRRPEGCEAAAAGTLRFNAAENSTGR